MSLLRDLRYNFRSLRQAPGFSATAIITMALGIGATTAIFSVCDAMLWKPIPLPHLETMVMVVDRSPDNADEWNGGTPADIDDVRSQSTTLQSIASYQTGLANIVATGGEPERVEQALVTANFFDVAGVQPALGRGFQPGEDQPGREHEVVFSDSFWRRRFGAETGIVGKTIRLDDEDYVVAGVMPPKFAFPLSIDAWTPIALKPALRHSRDSESLTSVARIKPGYSPAQVSAELDGLARRLEGQYPDTNKNRRFKVMPTQEFLVGREDRQYALMLFGAVIFVLLIACVNVANLQFARSTGRLREVAVRTALGAARWRLVAQLMGESLMLSLTGAALGVVVAHFGLNGIRAGMPARIGRYIVGWDEIHLDFRTLAFLFAAAAAAGLLAGLIPAWQSSRPNLIAGLRDGGRGSSTGRARRRLRAILVGAEISLAVVLLVGAGLMVRGFRTLVNRAKVAEPETVLALRMTPTSTKYPGNVQRNAFYQSILQRVSTLPGVRSAAVVTALPYSGHSNGRLFTIEGRPAERGQAPASQYQAVTPRYFEMFRVPLIQGRFLSDADGPDSPRVAVISEPMARRWWPHESPIGKRFHLGDAKANSPWITIVGVVGGMYHFVEERSPRAAIYTPFTQSPGLWMDVGIRTVGDPLRIAPAVIGAIRSIDPDQPITGISSLETMMSEQAVGLNYMAVLMGVFGVLALVLSTVGVYGVMAYLVSEQTQEIGIRIALGAGQASVLGMVFRRGMLTTVIGLAVGMVMAFGFARMLASLIFGVSATDPATFIGIPLALIAAAMLAIYIPARRAAKIDPIIALRYE